MRTATALLLALVLATAAQAGDVYRWKDAKGEVHYSDQPVPGAERVRSTRQSARDAAPVKAADPATRPATPATAPAAGSLTDKVRTDVAADKAGKCKEAQTNYEQAIGSRRLFRQGPNGEQIFLNDQEIEAARVTARANMEYYCGK